MSNPKATAASLDQFSQLLEGHTNEDLDEWSGLRVVGQFEIS